MIVQITKGYFLLACQLKCLQLILSGDQGEKTGPLLQKRYLPLQDLDIELNLDSVHNLMHFAVIVPVKGFSTRKSHPVISPVHTFGDRFAHW